MAVKIGALAEDVYEEGVDRAKRVMKSVERGVDALGDVADKATYRVKRQPLKAIGIAVGAGLVAGVVIGWFSSACVGRGRS